MGDSTEARRLRIHISDRVLSGTAVGWISDEFNVKASSVADIRLYGKPLAAGQTNENSYDSSCRAVRSRARSRNSISRSLFACSRKILSALTPSPWRCESRAAYKPSDMKTDCRLNRSSTRCTTSDQQRVWDWVVTTGRRLVLRPQHPQCERKSSRSRSRQNRFAEGTGPVRT